MDSQTTFFISDSGKMLSDNGHPLRLDEATESLSFQENLHFRSEPAVPILHLIEDRKVAATVQLEPTTFHRSGRKGFTADAEIESRRITVRLVRLSSTVFGVTVNVSEVPPLEDILEVFRREGIHSGDQEAAKSGRRNATN